MGLYDIAVDLGGYSIKMGLCGTEKIIVEPSLVAVPLGEGELLCGNNAYKAFESRHRDYRFVRPIEDGLITDQGCAVKLVNSVCRRLLSQTSKEPEVRGIIAVTEGATSEDILTFENVFAAAGIQPVRFIESGLVGGEEAFSQYKVNCGTVVNIGYDKTEISVIRGGEVVEGCCVVIGGRNIDLAVADVIENKYGITVATEQAAYIKNKCVRFVRGDMTTVIADGISINRGETTEVRVSARDFFEISCRTMEPIVLAVNSVYNSLDGKLLREVKPMGLFITGGCAKLYGIESFFSNCLRVPSRIVQRSELTVLSGIMHRRKGE